jgi:DNA-directed RNA polymerase subunit M/transcription elongation factor TFIIS
MKTWTVKDLFSHKCGSNVWPSSDPNDSPYDTFTCKECGYTFKEQIYGAFTIGEKRGEERAEEKMLNHIAMFHKAGLVDEN